MIEIVILCVAFLILAVLFWLVLMLKANNKPEQNALLLQQLEEKHREMLRDLNDGLNKLGDRLSQNSQASSELLRNSVSAELIATREAMQALQLAQQTGLASTRETILQTLHNTLSEQGKSQQVLINDTMLKATTTLTQSIESLTKAVDSRLEQIGGKVSERLDEGFKKLIKLLSM